MYGEKTRLERQDYLDVANTYLLRRYAICLADTGYIDDDWLERFGDFDVEDAVELYAEKYDLVSFD